MSNIHGLHSNRPRSPSPPDENNRYVGGVSARGGGSGLAVEPNPDDIFSQATPSSSTEPTRRTITMYRSGFTVDDGPYRRLDDPENAEFLTALARGRTPGELAAEGDVQVGLVDKRSEEFTEEDPGLRSFSGAGEALGASSGVEGGVILPSRRSSEEGGSSSVSVRLLNGKSIVVKIDGTKTVTDLAERINATGMAGEEPYVLVAGFPPKVIADLGVTIKDAGLVGARIMQKKG